MSSQVLDQFNVDPFKFHERKVPISRYWSIATKRGGILQSKCTCRATVENAEAEKNQDRSTCNICRFVKALPKLSGLPEMLFHDSFVRLDHKMTGVSIEFSPIDALKEVQETQDPLRVAVADGWQSARADFPFANRIHKPFDWTYTTEYKGTLVNGYRKSQQKSHLGRELAETSANTESSIVQIKVEETEERIDMNKLKEKEEIIFYEDITLYEDELADHGVSKYNVKVRVMPGSLYLLARLYLRIDGVLVRINDTRLYHDFRKNYLLREYTNREARIKSLNLPLSTLLDPNELMSHLPLIQKRYEKLTLP